MRILIREIVVDVDDNAKEVILAIHWDGGRHTELRIPTTPRGRTHRCTDEESIAIVKRMAGCWSDHAIATTLNRVGSRTGNGNTWTDARVRALRCRLSLPACDPQHRDQSVLTCDEAAKKLGISRQYLGQLLTQGVIPGTQIARGTPWIIDAKQIESAHVRATLRTLRQRGQRKRTDDDQNTRIPGL